MSSVLSTLFLLGCLLFPHRTMTQELVFFVDNSSSTSEQLFVLQLPFMDESQSADKASHLRAALSATIS